MAENGRRGEVDEEGSREVTRMRVGNEDEENREVWGGGEGGEGKGEPSLKFWRPLTQIRQYRKANHAL